MKKKQGKELTYEQIDSAVAKLYGGWDCVPADSVTFIQIILSNGDFEAVYKEVRGNEKQAKDMLIDIEGKYSGVMNSDNVNSVIRILKSKQ